MTKIEEYHFLPSPVVESRWKEKKFVPEVLTADGNFIVGEPCNTHGEATTIALIVSEEITAKMLEVCRKITSRYKKAKE